MILVAGGQLDINIGVLLRRMLRRGVSFRELLVGPDLTPQLRIDLKDNTFELNGETLSPTGCFIRHDVFLNLRTSVPAARATATNWYYAVRGWIASQSSIRIFNQQTQLRENNKIQNLLLAREIGLAIPDSIVTNDFADFEASSQTLIQKPVAGGEYTSLLRDFLDRTEPAPLFPRFVQPRLQQPELRVYRIGSALFAFRLHSSELDYRTTQQVEIEAVSPPEMIRENFLRLCDQLGLDFAAADFMQDESGDLRFLEVNSQPMFAAFDKVVEGRICDAIIDHLMET